MTISWTYLLLAAAVDALYGIGLYHSRGFSVFWPSVLSVVSAVLTTWLLSLSMKGLPIGVAFVVWSGLASVGIAVYGIAVLGESRDLLRLGFIALIIGGVAGLKLTSAH